MELPDIVESGVGALTVHVFPLGATVLSTVNDIPRVLASIATLVEGVITNSK